MVSFVWWEVESQDPASFQHFFRELFGWQFFSAFADTALGAAYWTIHETGRTIGGLQQATSDAGPAQVGTRLYVEVDNLEAILEQVVSLGGTLERPRTELGGDDRWFATFAEPSGVSFGLWTAKPPAQT